MSKVKRTISAGGVVLNPLGQVLLVSQRGTSVSFPKGHVESGEKPRQTARREIEEETGIPREDIHFVERLGKYSRFKIGKHGKGEDRSERKTIIMYLYQTDWQGPTIPIDLDHHPKAWWSEPLEALELLTHPKDKKFWRSIRRKLLK